MRVLGLLAAVVLLLLGGCSPGRTVAQSDLEDARERWEATGVDSYSMTIDWAVFHPVLNGDHAVEVVGGTVVAYSRNGEPTDPGDLDILTVEGLFDRIDGALERSPDETDIQYAQEGRPLVIHINFDRAINDEELWIDVVEFDAGP